MHTRFSVLQGVVVPIAHHREGRPGSAGREGPLRPAAREELAKVPTTPGSLEGALSALRAGHDFFLKGDVFTQDVIDTWIDYKMTNEVKALALRPHPWEYVLYFDMREYRKKIAAAPGSSSPGAVFLCLAHFRPAHRRQAAGRKAAEATEGMR